MQTALQGDFDLWLRGCPLELRGWEGREEREMKGRHKMEKMGDGKERVVRGGE